MSKLSLLGLILICGAFTVLLFYGVLVGDSVCPNTPIKLI